MSGSGGTRDPNNDHLLCYNKGCAQRFLPADNCADSCLYHPGFPIFHDALKGWSCCRKRTTDFSEFLAIQGCMKGPHSNEKPPEALRPDVCGSKSEGPTCEMIMRGPKSAEKMMKERPSTHEEMRPLHLNVSQSLEQQVQRLRLSEEAEAEPPEESAVVPGTRCKHAGCKQTYEGAQSEEGTCVHHPGTPVFHEGMKFWSCCCIRTSDFNEFLDQKGCSNGRHVWVQVAGKQEVACRYDWHQTSALVVITVYAKNSIPDLSKVLANRTELEVLITFQKEKEFRKKLELWGVINVEESFVSLFPTKAEITLRKCEAGTWGRLELTAPEPQLTGEPQQPRPQDGGHESDDSLSWSESDELE